MGKDKIIILVCCIFTLVGNGVVLLMNIMDYRKKKRKVKELENRLEELNNGR